MAAGQQQLLALNAEVSFQMAPDPYDNADRASKLQVMSKQFDPSRLKMQGGDHEFCRNLWRARHAFVAMY